MTEKKLIKTLSKQIETLTVEPVEFTFPITDVKDPKQFPVMTDEEVTKYFQTSLSMKGPFHKSPHIKSIHANSKPKLIKYDPRLYNVMNGFHDACCLAFCHHCPLILSPDMFWTAIMQGVAHHINYKDNAEKFRKAFVSHEGKVKITVRRDEFVREAGKNDWSTVIPEFSEKIKPHIGEKTHGLIINDFSTTGPTERISSEIVMMDMLQSYFSYEFLSGCGIPYITMMGTEQDWNKLYEKTVALCKFNSEQKLDLDFWLKELEPVMKQVCQARSGKIDKRFWESLYKYNNESGGPYASGWICVFYPYINRHEKMEPSYCLDWHNEKKRNYGLTYDSFPSAVAKVPFVWNFFGTEINMNFMGGMTGVSQNPKTMAVKPEFSWIVAEL